MFSEPVTLGFVFKSIGVIFAFIAVGIYLVKRR
jgi:flagellar biogenesis protein FliO